jgi:hypothetical protein
LVNAGLFAADRGSGIDRAAETQRFQIAHERLEFPAVVIKRA